MVKNPLIPMMGVLLLSLIPAVTQADDSNVRLKDIARVEGARDVSVVGYGLVVGLSGSGDSARNKATLQSLANTLRNFGLMVDSHQLSSRNAASVMITADLPPYGEPGSRIDVTVSALGDARSLNGGTLLLAPLYGPDQELYVLSQGAVTVGGYEVESFSDLRKKNHVTVGSVSEGGTIERRSPMAAVPNERINILLNQPDYTTAERVATAIRQTIGDRGVQAIHPGKVSVEIPNGVSPVSYVSRLEHVIVSPDSRARVVVSERTGTIVAGSNVLVGAVNIAHGSLRVDIDTKFNASQPRFVYRGGSGVQTVVLPDTNINVEEGQSDAVLTSGQTTVGELVQALNRIHVSTRDVITILQLIKSAGALHAELIIQ